MGVDADVALLRRFEPVMRCTRGERFFPMDIEPYVRLCSLWARRPKEESVCLVPQGALTLEDLASPHPDVFGTVHYLKLTDPLGPAELARYLLKTKLLEKRPENVFRAGTGRLARVGYLSRLVDAAFSVTLLARGRVPGDMAAAASITYERLMSEREHYSYYGRVVRENGWIVLQYWFFYLFDDWRTGFFGANDHEADWEMISLYLYESESGTIIPEWAAYAAHDQAGDDLRRRWDDPELEKIGEHPVVYVGAGSHASYFQAGEYMTEIEMPFLAPYAKVADAVQGFWRDKLRQYAGEEPQVDRDSASRILNVPFVDYARGDGLSIGPGQAKEWSCPGLLTPPPLWATAFKGLWGLYTRDPFQGEDAPAGPVYKRDGSVRRTWYDVLGWAGLDKLPIPRRALDDILRLQAELADRRATTGAMIEDESRQLMDLGVEAASMRGQPNLGKQYQLHVRRIDELSRETESLRAQIASDDILNASLDHFADQLRRGQREPARAHILRPNRPASDVELRADRLAEIWSAASVGLMLLSFVGVVLFARESLLYWLIVLLALFVIIEASFRHQLTGLVTMVTIGLATAAMFVILYEFIWPMAVAVALAAGFYILWENLRELWT